MKRETGVMQRALPLLLALAGVAAGLFFLLFLNHRFFFMDDRQAQYFPYGLIIRDKLLHGEFPFLTTHTFYGGALWLDWQYGIYNPLSLLMDLMIDPQHLEWSGFLFAIVSNLLLTAGAYALGRSYGLERSWAALLGLLMGLNIYIVYRGSAAWQPGVSSLAWMMFAWAALKHLLAAEKNIAGHMLLAAVLMYLMVSTGWPHTTIAFALIAGALFVEAWLKEKNGRHARRLIYTGLLGTALCLPVIVPVAAALSWTARSVIPDSPLFHPRAADILNVSNPLWHPFMTSGTPGPQPLLFLAWFALPALALIDWKKVRWQRLVPLAGLAYLFFILANAGFGPLLTLRYPVRWVAFFHVCALTALLTVLQENRISRDRAGWSFALLLAPMLAALAFHLDTPAPAFGAAIACCGALGLWIWKPKQTPLLLGATSLVIFGLIFAAYPANPDVIDWGKHDNTVATAENPRAAPVIYTIIDTRYPYIPRGIQDDDEHNFTIAAMGAYFHGDTLNGYSSLGQKGLERLMHCSLYAFILCAYHTTALLEQEPETHASYLDLFKVGHIIATKHDGVAATVKKHEPPGWTENDNPLVATFDRQKKMDLPGTLSWHSPGITIADPSGLESNGEVFQLKNGPKPGLLVFARLFYPGFHATVDNTPLTVRPVGDVLLGVDVPAGAEGRLTLSFTPPFLWPCVALSILALVVWLVVAVRERQKPNM